MLPVPPQKLGASLIGPNGFTVSGYIVSQLAFGLLHNSDLPEEPPLGLLFLGVSPAVSSLARPRLQAECRGAARRGPGAPAGGGRFSGSASVLEAWLPVPFSFSFVFRVRLE